MSAPARLQAPCPPRGGGIRVVGKPAPGRFLKQHRARSRSRRSVRASTVRAAMHDIIRRPSRAMRFVRDAITAPPHGARAAPAMADVGLQNQPRVSDIFAARLRRCRAIVGSAHAGDYHRVHRSLQACPRRRRRRNSRASSAQAGEISVRALCSDGGGNVGQQSSSTQMHAAGDARAQPAVVAADIGITSTFGQRARAMHRQARVQRYALFRRISRWNPSAFSNGWDGAACAAPWPRSGGCARALP